ncbi:MAG TPA: IS3 family transposase [Negativicutes bacterium]|nr:IS3 family transposase [Negativicutes bacterium]
MAVSYRAPAKSKKQLAEELGVSRQSLYYQPKLPEKDLLLKSEIETVMAKHKRYGHKRIAMELRMNKKRIRRVMKLFGLKPKRNRKAPGKPQDQHQAPMTIPNLLKEMLIEAPNQAWVNDFTYLPYFGRFVYLATTEDLFTREIIGWAVSPRHDADLVIASTMNALKNHPAPAISHSDQGSEYRGVRYQGTLLITGIKPSMSEKASPWQNGHQEGFYSEFKLELGHPEAYLTLGELIEAIALQIHYYNYQRIHTALKCPPTVFAEKCKLQKISKIAEKKLTFQNTANQPSV